MRKLVSVILSTLMLFNFCIAQDTYFRYWKTPDSERALRCLVTDDGNYLLVGEKDTTGTLNYSYCFLLKLNSFGDITSEKTIKFPGNRSYLSIIDKYPTENNQYLCIGAIDSITSSFLSNKLILCKINDNLEFEWFHKSPSMINKAYMPWHDLILNDSIFYLQSTFYFQEQQSRQIAVSKFKLPFDSISTYITPLDYTQRFSQGIRYNELTNSIDAYFLGSSFKSPSPNPTYNNYLKLDVNLNLIGVNSFPGWNSSVASLCEVNDSSFLITGSGNDPFIGSRFVMIHEMNNIGDSLKSLLYQNNPDTNIYAGAGINTMINDSNIFVAAYYNVDAMTFPWQNMPDWIQITKTDLSLNVISHHYFGGDAVYLPYSIIPTSDGGGFVTGLRYDYLGNLPQGVSEFDIFALKFNCDGIVVDIPENETWKMSDAIVYPNPGSDYLVVQSGPQVSGAVFRMYDMQGRQVMEQRLTSTLLRISTGSLAAGTYPWQIIFNNKVIESGKWVKGR